MRDGDTPRITVSNSNNGIVGYYSDVNDPQYRVYKNFISVSFLGTVFYQPNRASLDMKVHCLKPLKVKLNDNIAGFLVSVIRESIANYMYDDQLSSEVLANLDLMLPINESGNPDWIYMDSYMSKIFSETNDIIKKLSSVI